MSKKLQQAIQAEVVSVNNKSSSEVMVIYFDRARERQTVLVPPLARGFQLAPRLTSAALLRHGNLPSLLKTVLSIV